MLTNIHTSHKNQYKKQPCKTPNSDPPLNRTYPTSIGTEEPITRTNRLYTP